MKISKPICHCFFKMAVYFHTNLLWSFCFSSYGTGKMVVRTCWSRWILSNWESTDIEWLISLLIITKPLKISLFLAKFRLLFCFLFSWVNQFDVWFYGLWELGLKSFKIYSFWRQKLQNLAPRCCERANFYKNLLYCHLGFNQIGVSSGLIVAFGLFDIVF